jgi:phenylpropionate dioxygenase-like ring-hydroxylating dioxygenase large terminal subunit
MREDAAARLVEAARVQLVEHTATTAGRAFTIPADRYRSPAWLERERAVLAGPRIVALSSRIARSSVVPIDGGLLVRDAAGTLRAFANACRHRATRLVDAPGAAKAIVCPYHGWTYGLDGALLHAPHEQAFAGYLPVGADSPAPAGGARLPQVGGPRRDLTPLPVVERHGLVWMAGEAAAGGDVVAQDDGSGESLGAHLDRYLGAIAADLDAAAFDRHVVFREARVARACNWKLVIEAFLDGYHIRTLHRDSIYRFFVDGGSVAEHIGQHVRAVTVRRALLEAAQEVAARGTIDARVVSTPSLTLFPATTIIEHPDFVSIITVAPLGPDRTDYRHWMLVPADRAHETAHWDRSWQLIEETVFQREDLWVCEQVQRGLAEGHTDELLFGALEHAVEWFHADLDAAMAAVE